MNFSKYQLIRIVFLVFATICLNSNNLAVVDATASSSSSSSSSTNNDDDHPRKIVEKWIAQAREQYQTLPDQGKFCTGAVVGFGASKIAVNSAVKFVKLAGAAFIATEALEAAGILDMDQAFDSNGIEKESVKRRALTKISELRTTIRQKLDGENIKKWMEQDRMGVLGAATGAFFGFLL